MKIIEAKNLEINRAATIDAQALKIVNKFNSLLKNKSFDGLSEINKIFRITLISFKKMLILAILGLFLACFLACNSPGTDVEWSK